MIYIDLILNLSLLVSLSIVSSFIEKHWTRKTWLLVLLQGALFGGVAVLGMLKPVNIGPGLIFDGRSIMVSLCAFFWGPWAASIASLMAIACRISLGGTGMVTGSIVVLATAGAGLLAHYRFNPKDEIPSALKLYLFGVVVHLIMLAAMFTLPKEIGLSVVKSIGLPVMLFYPLATILAGKILSDQILARRVLAALQKSEKRLVEAQHIAKVGDFTWDVKTGEVTWSDAMFDLLKYDKSEKIDYTKVNEKIHHPDDLERVTQWLNDGISSGNEVLTPNEYRIVRKDGEVIYVRTTGVIKQDKGKSSAIFATIQDITEHKQAEEELRYREKQYRSLFNSIRDAILVADTNRTIIDCNPAFIDLFGYSKKEMLGKQTLTVYESEEEFRKMGAAIKNNVGDPGFLYTVHYKKIDGSIFPGETNVFYLRNDEDSIIGFIGLIRDVTDRKRVEKDRENLQSQLRQSQKMESVGRLAGGVAHDYNNALTVIMGFTELAMMDADPAGPLHDDLNQVLKAGRRAQDITRQLLAFARKQTIAPIVLDLNDTVESMIKMLRRLIGEDIDLAWLPGSGLWPVKMDPSQIDQVLANLCVNARDAITDVGKITIETENMVLDAAYCADHSGFVPGKFVQLSVSDNGCGMDKEILNNIFEPFFTTKAVDKGTGLGLSMVYGIIKQNNGFINAYSEPGKGTTIKIYLPQHEGRIADIQKESTTEIPQGKGETLLVVEDNHPILKLTQKILSSLSYTVLTADTPKGAISLAREHTCKINLLITDVVMPEMNGLELSERLKSLCPDLKYIFMSGYTANAIAHHGVLDPGVDFIQKPFSKRDLATIIREVLDRK